jgi:hypothetical protein
VQVGNGTQVVVEAHWNIQVLTLQFPIPPVLLHIILGEKTPVIRLFAEAIRLPFVILPYRQAQLGLQLPHVWELPIISLLTEDHSELQLHGNGIPVHAEEPMLAQDQYMLPVHLRPECTPIMFGPKAPVIPLFVNQLPIRFWILPNRQFQFQAQLLPVKALIDWFLLVRVVHWAQGVNGIGGV